jgi:hypothetical protein
MEFNIFSFNIYIYIYTYGSLLKLGPCSFEGLMRSRSTNGPRDALVMYIERIVRLTLSRLAGSFKPLAFQKNSAIGTYLTTTST